MRRLAPACGGSCCGSWVRVWGRWCTPSSFSGPAPARSTRNLSGGKPRLRDSPRWKTRCGQRWGRRGWNVTGQTVSCCTRRWRRTRLRLQRRAGYPIRWAGTGWVSFCSVLHAGKLRHQTLCVKWWRRRWVGGRCRSSLARSCGFWAGTLSTRRRAVRAAPPHSSRRACRFLPRTACPLMTSRR